MKFEEEIFGLYYLANDEYVFGAIFYLTPITPDQLEKGKSFPHRIYINRKDKEITVYNDKVKTDDPENLPLTDELFKVLTKNIEVKKVEIC